MADSEHWATAWGQDLSAAWARELGGDGNGDDAFDNSSYVPEAGALLEQWVREAQALRDALGPRARLGQLYGMHPREAFDLFLPEGVPAGVMVFVHGGYWMRLDRSVWSGLAAGALERGWAVVMPSYPLAPEAPIARITEAIGAAVTRAAALVDGPVRLVGHSAGGHLVSRMLCDTGPLPDHVAARIAKVVSISGLHDLRPFLSAPEMNATLQLTQEMAAAESPALAAPRAGVPVTAYVGGQERPELIRQSALLAQAWPQSCTVVVDAPCNHFTVINALADPGSRLVDTILS
jgi:arylformamidase